MTSTTCIDAPTNCVGDDGHKSTGPLRTTTSLPIEFARISHPTWRTRSSPCSRVATGHSTTAPACSGLWTMTKRSRSEDTTELSQETVPIRPRLEVNTVDTNTEDCPTRIVSWNVETPVPFLQLSGSKARAAANTTPGVALGSNPSFLRELIRRHNFPDFICLQEVRARKSDKEWISALLAAANISTRLFQSAATGNGGNDEEDRDPRYTMHHSLNRSTRGQRHFGVATFVRDPGAVASAREVEWDAEGRVLILEMYGGWALVNVYGLNGSEFMWRDPLGQAAPKTRNERKREFNRLLMQECVALQGRGLRVVLVGDFNISLGARDCHPRLRTEYPHGLARAEFTEQFLPGVNVVDVFREKYPDRKAYSWFAKGKPQGADCARVDYALVERTLAENVVDITYLEDPQQRGHSDHAPFLLTMKDMHALNATQQNAYAIEPAMNQSQPVT